MTSLPPPQLGTLKRKHGEAASDANSNINEISSVPESPQKRSKSNLTQTQSILKNSSVYYEDGNIVIIAENVAFRAHRGVLSKRCEVFRDMFVVGRPCSSDETFEDCPVVRVSDLSKDWEAFLEVLYGYRVVDVLDHPEHVKAILRLGKKYRADALFKEILVKLERICPVSLSKLNLGFYKKYGSSGLQFMKVLLDVDALYHLPGLFYNLYDENLTEIQKLGLSPVIQAKLYRGLHLLTPEYAIFVSKTIVSYKVARGECCPRRWRTLQARLCKEAITSVFNLDRVRPMEAAGSIQTVFRNCHGCSSYLNERISDFRKDLFARLPEIFDLGESWKELKKITYNGLP